MFSLMWVYFKGQISSNLFKKITNQANLREFRASLKSEEILGRSKVDETEVWKIRKVW